MLVVACDDLMGDAEAGKDEAVLAVAVGCLVEVHEVHVDRVVRKLFICLRVQMKERLVQELQALDPHLGRGEGVHPCDDADAVIIAHDLLHVLDADFGRLDRREQLDADRARELFI